MRAASLRLPQVASQISSVAVKSEIIAAFKRKYFYSHRFSSGSDVSTSRSPGTLSHATSFAFSGISIHGCSTAYLPFIVQ